MNPEAILALADELFISAKVSLYFHSLTDNPSNLLTVQQHLKNPADDTNQAFAKATTGILQNKKAFPLFYKKKK